MNAGKLLLTSVALIAALGIAVHVDLADATNETSTITVSGSAATTLDADRLNIELGVFTVQDTATESLRENSEQLNRVIDAVKSVGISEDDISTARFSLYPEYDDIHDPLTNSYVRELVGYRVTNMISIHTDQLDMAADILDGAVSAGANRIDRVWFDVTPERESEARNNLISAAVDNAKHQATLAISPLDYDIVGIRSITLTDAGFAYVASETQFRLVDSASSSPPVLAGEQHLSVSVVITFYID